MNKLNKASFYLKINYPLQYLIMKNSLLLFLFIFMATFAFGQLGLKAGANISNISTDEDNIENLKSKIGFQGGLMYRIKLLNILAIQPEVLYTRKGADYEILGAEVEANMDYLDIPLLLILQFDSGLQFHGGLQASYLLQSSVKYANVSFMVENEFEADREDFEDFDYGLVAGIGYLFKNVSIDLRYTRGLKDFEKDTSIGDLEITPSSKHFGLQASLGIFF